VRQAGPREKAALQTQRRRTTIIHRTVRWCTGLSGESFAANSSLSGNGKGDVAIIHRTVRWCTGLSGEPTVASATVGRTSRGRHVARSNGPVRQLPPRTNGQMRQKKKEIAHRTARVTVRWCTGLSGAPPDRRQVWPSKLASNGS
jgi:adenylylsulfate kinase-like enzyme